MLNTPTGLISVGAAGGVIVTIGSDTIQSDGPTECTFLTRIRTVPPLVDAVNDVTGEPLTVVDALQVEPLS